MSARTRRATLLSVVAFTLWSVGLTPLIIDRASPVAAAQRPCITLPDAVPSWAAARERNPRVCPPAPETTYTLRTTDEQSLDPMWKTSYSAYATYDVFFALDVSGTVTDEHSYTLEIFAPGGLPYQRIDVTYTSTSCTPTFACSVDQTSDGIRVWTSLPVAGTTIQGSQLYGTWTADAYIDGAGSPNVSTFFDITS